MLEELLNYNRNHKIFRNDDRILLAVSGGVDSMVLSFLLIKLRIKVGIAHCNFSLRGEESDMDEDLVKKFALENEIPYYSVRFKTKEYAHSKGISVQMAARELRYEWFEKIRIEKGYDLIAVAHNLNDNVETMLINLTRGTGITGLSGMRPVANNIIRPLLFASRNNILNFCKEHNIRFREDKSNAETRYTRNKIRHLVIPLLKEINPSVEETLIETIERFSGIDEIVTEYTNAIKEQVVTEKNNLISFDVHKLNRLGTGKAMIFEIFSHYGISAGTLNDLLKLLSDEISGKKILTKTHKILRNRNEIIVSRIEHNPKKSYWLRSLEDLRSVQGIESAEIIDKISGFKVPADKNIACIDFEKIKYPMLIRSWEKGDYFFPLGMNHRKKLSDYFIDRKYSLLEKEKVLILESSGEIVWILGERLDERYRISESTTKVLLIRLSPCRS